MANATTITDSDILGDVIAAEEGDLTPEAARSILRWKFSKKATARMTRLASRNAKGTISEAELKELERYLRIGSLLNLLQAKARLSLRAGAVNES